MRASPWVSLPPDNAAVVALEPVLLQNSWQASTSIFYEPDDWGYPSGGQANQKAFADTGNSYALDYLSTHDDWTGGSTVPGSQRTVNVYEFNPSAWAPDSAGGLCGKRAYDDQDPIFPYAVHDMSYLQFVTVLRVDLPSQDDIGTVITAEIDVSGIEPPGDGNEAYSFIEMATSYGGYLAPETLTLTFNGAADATRNSGTMHAYALAPEGVPYAGTLYFDWNETPPPADGWVDLGSWTVDTDGVNTTNVIELDLTGLTFPAPTGPSANPSVMIVLTVDTPWVDPTIAPTNATASTGILESALSWTSMSASMTYGAVNPFGYRWIGGVFSDDGPGRSAGTYLAIWSRNGGVANLSSVRATSPATELSRVVWPFGDATTGVPGADAILGFARPDGRAGTLVNLLMSGVEDDTAPPTSPPVVVDPPPTVVDPPPVVASSLSVTSSVSATHSPTIQDMSYVAARTT